MEKWGNEGSSGGAGPHPSGVSMRLPVQLIQTPVRDTNRLQALVWLHGSAHQQAARTPPACQLEFRLSHAIQTNCTYQQAARAPPACQLEFRPSHAIQTKCRYQQPARTPRACQLEFRPSHAIQSAHISRRPAPLGREHAVADVRLPTVLPRVLVPDHVPAAPRAHTQTHTHTHTSRLTAYVLGDGGAWTG